MRLRSLVVAVVSRLVDLRHGAHVLVHRHSDPIRQFPRQFDRAPAIQRLVKFSLGGGRGVLLAVFFFFFESSFLPPWVARAKVRPQMMQAGSNPALSAYRASPETLPDPFSEGEGSAATILSESKVAGEV